MRRTRTRTVTGILAAIVVLAIVPAASAALHVARAPADCTRSQLNVRSNGQRGAAGTIRGAWVFTNRSATDCTLNGYPDLQLYGRTGRPLSTTVQTTLPPAPSAVTLAPGGSGTFLSSYSDVISGSDRCPTSAVIQITAPNATGSHFIPAELHACTGVIQVSAVEAGVHHA
jgi:Domain of unknown function (DUF4232)